MALKNLYKGGGLGEGGQKIGPARRLADLLTGSAMEFTECRCTFETASRREEKGEGLGEERARDFAGREAGGFLFEVF